MRRLLALLVLGALVVGVIYVWKYQPGRLPSLRQPKLGNVGDKLGGVGDKLGQVGETVSEKFRATKIKGAVKAALELNRNLNAYPIEVDAQDDGTVMLRGEVPSEDLRSTAARVAASVPDVARVENDLRVNGGVPAPQGEGRRTTWWCPACCS